MPDQVQITAQPGDFSVTADDQTPLKPISGFLKKGGIRKQHPANKFGNKKGLPEAAPVSWLFGQPTSGVHTPLTELPVRLRGRTQD